MTRDSMKATRPVQASAAVVSRIIGSVDAFIADPAGAEAAVTAGSAVVPAETLANLAAVERLPSYRDGVLIQLAFGLDADETFDHTHRAEGGRSAAAAVGAAFAARHIRAVKDAFQNIGKNQPNLARGNEPAFDALLRWMNGRQAAERAALFRYLAARVALTARPVLAMPALRPAALTFAAVASFLDALVDVPSRGAFEQFAVAALLEALLDEYGLTGVNGLRVETKGINASDASTGSAADVQVMRGNRVEEAFEVSANDWRGKVTQAVDVVRSKNLARAHIIAAVKGGDRDLAPLADAAAEVTLSDVRAFVRILTAALRRPGREAALRRLYELIDRNQPNPELTNSFVRLLGDHQLTAS